jgi:60 kDa SS-A/Ro ribonucleoprotein
MTRFNSKHNNRTVNKAGGFAYKMGVEQELVHAVLSTFLEDKYYESGDERIDRIVDLVQKNKPEFVAKLAVVARKEFNLRSVTHVLIGELAKCHKGDNLVMKTIEKCALRPDDLIEICAYLGKPIPKQVKRGIRHTLLNYSPYQLAKYRAEGNKWSLVDLFNIARPNPKYASSEQKKAWKALIEGKLKSFDTWETKMSNDKNKKKVWTDLISEGKIGYMALLRNLNNIIKYNVSDRTINQTIKILTDRENIKNSKQLPFRFWMAYKNVTGNRKLTDAISEAMDIAVSNTPELKGKTLIAIDASGSMNGDPIEKAAIFGATLLKANSNSDVILYDDQIKEFTGSGRTPVVYLADRIIQDATGGGTNTSLVFEYAINSGTKYDRIIIISDNESWQDSGYDWIGGNGTQATYTEYKKQTSTDPFVYAIDIQGYGTKDVTGGSVKHICGWSARLLDFIGESERGNELIDYIASIEL